MWDGGIFCRSVFIRIPTSINEVSGIIKFRGSSSGTGRDRAFILGCGGLLERGVERGVEWGRGVWCRVVW